jgi:ABC-type Mn2+/Zn2+ transport system ATPase subunit
MAEHSLEVVDLTVSYQRVPALHHINFKLSCGRCVGLLGPNGAGKSTLLKAIAGLVKREAGRILLHGRDIIENSGQIAYLPQRESVDWDFPITVRGLVEMGRYRDLGLWKRFSAQDQAIVDEALEVFQLHPLAERQINALSAGQQQAAFIARSWAQQAHVYLLDEPFNGLDRNAQNGLKQALRRLTRAGKLVMVSHHQLATVPEIFDEVVLLNGELVASGAVQQVFTPELVDKTFATQIFAGVE